MPPSPRCASKARRRREGFSYAPQNPGYARLPIYKLCNLDKNLNKVPDKKAIKKWIEGEVLMHSLRSA